MTEIGKLIDIDPRQAWAHEAHEFTPWLAKHLDRLAETLGIPLELEGTEVAVESFSADIRARNPRDNTMVLIENQLEGTDHTHLGQVLTYLAGLEAQVIIWIATSFREPHLSAIKWLNEHTVEPFAFFAVRLRVVRIGDSPFAPIFEVLGRPNNWERTLQAKVRATGELSEIGQMRRDFWTLFVERHPEHANADGSVPALPNYWCELSPGTITLPYIARGGVGIFIRSEPPSETPALRECLLQHSDTLAGQLSVEVEDQGAKYLLGQDHKLDMKDRANWPAGADWIAEKLTQYKKVLPALLEDDDHGA